MFTRHTLSFTRLTSLVWAAFAALIVQSAAIAVEARALTWDRIANIKSSAIALSDLQKVKGAQGTYEFIANCYKTHELGSQYGAALEGCLVLDYLHSKVTAAVYSKLPPGERDRLGLPDPNQLVGAMLKRVGGAMANYRITEVNARKFVADIETHGLPVFAKARFPKGEE
jgi:hypothetical protein